MQPQGKTVAVLFLTPRCNMSCRFCVTEDGFDDVNPKEVPALLDRLKAEGFNNLVLGGGEPFLWKGDLLALAVEAKKRGFLVQVGTNGVAMPQHFEHLTEIDRFVLPLDAADRAVHNGLRHYRNLHLQIILSRLVALREANRKVTVSTVVTQINVPGLASIGRLLEKMHASRPFIHAWHLYNFIPEGRGGGVHAKALSIPRAEYDRATQAVKVMDLPFPVYRRPDMFHSKTVGFFWFENGVLRSPGERPAVQNVT